MVARFCLPILSLLAALEGPLPAAESTLDPMVEAARNLIATFTQEQRQQAIFPFSSEERSDWHYIPKLQRKGLSFKDMLPEQVHLTHVLLDVSLSRPGYVKTSTVMSLESLVRLIDMEAGRGEAILRLRDPFLYYVTFFGDPAAGGRWGWSLEGHHVSLNFTAAGGRLASTPMFLGAEPHEVLEGPRRGLRVLGREEDLARRLLSLLTPEQRSRAILAVEAPADIFSGAERQIDPEQPPKGLAAAAMTGEQQQALRDLIEVYIENVPPDLAAKRRRQYEGSAFELIHFAWMGSTEKGPGQGHYYRVQAPDFLIEYDNVQNQANHSHSVWRDYDGDFGRDLLGEHHRTAHLQR